MSPEVNTCFGNPVCCDMYSDASWLMCVFLLYIYTESIAKSGERVDSWHLSEWVAHYMYFHVFGFDPITANVQTCGMSWENPGTEPVGFIVLLYYNM